MIFPDYFRVLERVPDGWNLLRTKVFCSLNNRQYNPSDAWIKHGITKQKLVVELFRKFHGKLGFYLVNLKDKKYYYCGLTKKDIQNTLYAIGVGRKDNA